jgi:hypothetical protein
MTKVAASLSTVIRMINRSGSAKPNTMMLVKKKSKKWIVEVIRYTVG